MCSSSRARPTPTVAWIAMLLGLGCASCAVAGASTDSGDADREVGMEGDGALRDLVEEASPTCPPPVTIQALASCNVESTQFCESLSECVQCFPNTFVSHTPICMCLSHVWRCTHADCSAASPGCGPYFERSCSRGVIVCDARVDDASPDAATTDASVD